MAFGPDLTSRGVQLPIHPHPNRFAPVPGPALPMARATMRCAKFCAPLGFSAPPLRGEASAIKLGAIVGIPPRASS